MSSTNVSFFNVEELAATFPRKINKKTGEAEGYAVTYNAYRNALDAYNGRLNFCPNRNAAYRAEEPWSPDVPDELRYKDALREAGIEVWPNVVRTAWEDYVASLPRVSVLEHELSALQWDGVRRVDRLLIDKFGAPDEPLFETYSRIWLLRTVWRWTHSVRDDDANPNVLVLVGGGGLGKSTFCRDIAGEFEERCGNHKLSAKTRVQADAKSFGEVVLGKLVIEFEELVVDGSDAVRKMVTSGASFTYRPAYGREAKTFPMVAAQIATTNNERFLECEDPENERRYLPVPCVRKYVNPLNRLDYWEWKQVIAECMERNKASKPVMDITMEPVEVRAVHIAHLARFKSERVELKERRVADIEYATSSDGESRDMRKSFVLAELRNRWFAGVHSLKNDVAISGIRERMQERFKDAVRFSFTNEFKNDPAVEVVRKSSGLFLRWRGTEETRPAWTYADNEYGSLE